MRKDEAKSAELSNEDMQKVFNAVNSLGDLAPKDANVFFNIEIVDDRYFVSLKISADDMKVDCTQSSFDIENLLVLLNTECRSKIEEYRKTLSLA